MAEGQPIDEIIFTRLSNGEVQVIASTADAARRVKELLPNVNEGISPEYQSLHDDVQAMLDTNMKVFSGGFGEATRLDSDEN